MDLMGPVEVASLAGKLYIFVIVDDFSRYTWVSFLKEKSETFTFFKMLYMHFKNVYNKCVKRIRSDHGREFENQFFSLFCDKKGISHEFLAPITPQQNVIAERKNRTLQEMDRVMLSSMNLSKRLWAEAINTACHIINRVYLRRGTQSTPYEILNGKT